MEHDVISRQSAREAGLDTYFTGKPCKHGHVAVRWVRNSDCSECNKARAGKWHLEHHEEVLARLRKLAVDNAPVHRQRAKDWYYANPEKTAAQRKKWRTENPERKRELDTAWRKRHIVKERLRGIVKQGTRRAQQLASGGTFTKDDIARILKAQRGRCGYCRKRVGMRYHADHITALARGGSNKASNIQVLCPRCNTAKNARDPIDFAQLSGLLI